MPRNFGDAERSRLPLESRTNLARDTNGADRLITPNEAAHRLRVSHSWLAKARMRGDGPPFLKDGRDSLFRDRWPDGFDRQQRQSTSEQ